MGVKKRSRLVSFAVKGRVEGQADCDDTRASSARFALGSEQTILTKRRLRFFSVKIRPRDFRFGSIPVAERKSSIVRSWRTRVIGDRLPAAPFPPKTEAGVGYQASGFHHQECGLSGFSGGLNRQTDLR